MFLGTAEMFNFRENNRNNLFSGKIITAKIFVSREKFAKIYFQGKIIAKIYFQGK